MRTLVHLSDLHFGRIDPSAIDPLVRTITQLAPDLVVVSGDLTQAALPAEFQQARALLDRLPARRLVVPGNHDMSFYNPLRRLTQRLQFYRRYITDNLVPCYRDPEIAVLGLNTVRVSHLRDGRLRSAHLAEMERFFTGLPKRVTRVLVTHHPFDLPDPYTERELIGRAALSRVVACVDLMLAGHMHISYAGPTATRHKIAGNSAIFVQAGTALSTRVRGEENSFQAIRIEPSLITVERHSWDSGQPEFTPRTTARFRPSPSGWAAEAAPTGIFAAS